MEIVQANKIKILLAKETFHSKIAPVRAWAAQMELDGIKERIGMGVKARLKAGKANTRQDRYVHLRRGARFMLWMKRLSGSGKSLNGTTKALNCPIQVVQF